MATYEINRHPYTKGYYLADGIYPPWSIFGKTIHKPQDEKHSRFAKEQEATRKYMERAFGVLQSFGAVIRHHVRTWSR
jgi:adenine-specific DNA methylase